MEVDDVLLRHAGRGAGGDVRDAPIPGSARRSPPRSSSRRTRTRTSASSRTSSRQQLAPFKVPRRIVVVDEIPKGPTGKVQRIGLAERLGVEAGTSRPLTTVPVRLPRERAGRRSGSPCSASRAWASPTTSSRSAATRSSARRRSRGSGSSSAIPICRSLDRQGADAGGNGARGLRRDRPRRLGRRPAAGLGEPDTALPRPCRRRRRARLRVLARLLGPDQPSYALRAQGIDDGRATPSSLPELAAEYVEDVREVQPHGPYALGGFCLGGPIAVGDGQPARRRG